MYEDIRKNKIKTGFIVCVFVLVITLVVYYVCIAFDLGPFSVVIALIVSIVSAWSSYYYSDKIILSINKARPATPEENQQLIHVLDGLMVSSGLEYRPRLYVIDDPQPNAFATGRNPQNSIICVTKGLLDKLNYYELEGVIAHELSHIKNYDIRLSAIVTVMVGLIVMLADLVSRIFFWSGFSGDDDRDSGRGNVIFLLIGLVAVILAPIFGELMKLAISRKREYLADATAVEFTRNPDGLISALQKLEADPNELKTANKSTAHMYFISPFKNEKRKKKMSNIWSTHPSTEDRIAALRNLK